MDENPYAPPLAISESAIVLSGPQTAFRGVAAAQRVTIIGVLMLVLCFFASPAAFLMSPLMQVFFAIAVLLDLLVLTVTVFFLAIKLLSKLSNVALGMSIVVLALLPPVAVLGLLLLALLVNVKATRTLKKNGYEVGFFGARPAR
jgi:hypothetical protein